MTDVTPIRPQSKSEITPRRKAALATAINGVLAQCALLDSPRQYVTDTDAGIIISISALLCQVSDVELGVNLMAKGTQGNSTQTTAAAAVEKALEGL